MEVHRAYYQILERSTDVFCGCAVGSRAIIDLAMATQKSMLGEFAWDPRYNVSGAEDVLTPALVMFPEIVAENIARTLALLDDEPDRWRVHIKTAKLGYTVRMMVQRGIRNFKCATTLELLVACQCGASDVLLAYPSMGANAQRVREIAEQFPEVRISVLAENAEQARQWRSTRLGVFLDINPGMNRTGIEQNHGAEIVTLVRAIGDSGLEFRGLHYYDGHYGGLDERQRTEAAHGGYDRLLKIVREIEHSGIGVPEVITSGTPTFPSSLSFEGFRHAGFIHRVSPGTVVYCDATSLAQLPREYGYLPAVLVLTRVVSQPRGGIVTCDAGHKAVSADAGVPTCVVVGRSELTPLSPSEEHLPMAVREEAAGPQVGEALHLLPRHVCPTVNNFDCALLIRNGEVKSVEKVSARGREAPLTQATDQTVHLTG
jgi:D-serine deaminase-like pyridoxal phosphate-dependent protein